MANKTSRRKQRARSIKGQPTLKPALVWAAFAVAVIGAALALYSTNLSMRIATQGVLEAAGCSINDFVNCDLAVASSYATLMGIPVAWWGFLFYLFAGLSLLFAALGKNRRAAASWMTVSWLLSIGAVLFSLVKAYHLVQLSVVCLVCVAMYAVNIALLLLIPLAMGIAPAGWPGFISDWINSVRGEESDLKFEPSLPRWALVAVVVFGIGFIGMKRQVDQVEGNPNFNMELAMRGHYSRPVADIDLTDHAPVWGNPEGSVQVVEWADFQCPGCQVSAFHLRTVLWEYRDDVAFYFMNYPLDSNINENMQRQLHAQAGPAARAAVCSAEFGDFWEYHDDLFRNQVSLGPSLYRSLAEDRGWSVEEFEACMARDETTEKVKADLAAGQGIVASTPTIVINGRQVNDWNNTEFLREVLRRELDG